MYLSTMAIFAQKKLIFIKMRSNKRDQNISRIRTIETNNSIMLERDLLK
jgi:hypothetical protein